jgi:Tol biopolymer transport system component/DNA-binding beta-propeller fold protein YncE
MRCVCALALLLTLGGSHQPAPARANYDDMWPSWSPDGRRIVFVSTRDGDPEVYVLNADGSDPRRLTTAPGRDAHPAWSPDGHTIAFQSPRQGGHTRIFLMNADGSNQRALTSNTGFCGVPAWAPGARKIAFQCTDDLARVNTDKPWKLFVADASGGAMQKLTDGAGNDQVPHWSPDGQRVLFYSDRSGTDQLYTIAAGGGPATQLTRTEAANRAASWSPDGATILLQSEHSGIPSDIHKLDVTTGALTRLTSSRPQHGGAFLSPDGRTIAFQARAGRSLRIWLMNADGSGLRRLGMAPADPPDAPLILVSLTGEHAVAFISPDNGAFLGTVAAPGDPHEIAVTPGGRRALIATVRRTPAALTTFDIATRTTATLTLGDCAQPHDVRVSRDGTRAWAACAGTRTIVEADVNPDRVRRGYETGAEGGWFLAVTPDERKMYVPHLEGKQVAVIDRETGETKVVLQGGAMSGIDIAPDGRSAWVVNHERQRIQIIDTSTDAVVAAVPLESADFGRVRFTRDGRLVALVQGRTVHVIDAGSRRFLRRIDLPHEGKVIDTSTDGARAVISHPEAHRVSIVDLDSGRVVAVIAVGRGPDGVAWVH